MRQAGRKEETVTITTLQEFDPEQVDMFTVVLIGNSQSYHQEGKLITPRGYYREKTTDATGIGQEIMINSFRTIEKELKNKKIFLRITNGHYCMPSIPQPISKWKTYCI